MKLSTYECYVVTYWGEWVGTTLFSEQLYTDKNEAESAMQEAKESNLSLSNSGFKFKVQTLNDYMSDMRDEARWEGERNERDRSGY